MKSEVTVESLALYINRGITPKYTEVIDDSVIVLNQKCIRDFKVSLEPSRRNDLSKRKITEGKMLKKHDVLINSTGVGTLGRVAQYFGADDDATVDSHVTIVRPNPELVDPIYFGYLMKSKQSLIESFAEGTTGQTELNRNSVKELLLEIVNDIPTQKIIGGILLEIDQKLELNTQTNQTLEQIAQAIFKSWFVDFDPVKAKIEALAAGGSADDAELAAMGVISAKTLDELNGLKASNSEAFNKLAQTAALFPAAMQDSELGEIPEGWSYCTFGDISACFDSKRVPLSKRKREEKQPGTIPYYGATSVMDYVNEWIFDDTYLLLGEDGSVVKDDGTPFVQYIWGKSWVNNHAHVLQGNNGVSTEHLMVFIKGTNIASYVTGAVQLKLNQKNMNSIPFLKASTEINLVFQGVLNGLYDAYKNNIESSQSLSSLRDSLLPRLLSGEMELKDKE